jgi:hypothetical protein
MILKNKKIVYHLEIRFIFHSKSNEVISKILKILARDFGAEISILII